MKYLVVSGCSHSQGTGLGQAIKSKTKGQIADHRVTEFRYRIDGVDFYQIN